ncbi:unnamed protein product [Psylliodes chrysocephalus]|uniref:MADF domain-containing protein n=1 Tax=Psylliodes chrysocephalus TaxID=3402493 RepID=A0A9P0D3E4_9CUCU|nr:unnamed protein product [Psylliodes chrysocephala]
MEWSNDSVLQLINAYRIRPVLWNSLDSYYKIKNKKEDAWRELADMLNTDIAEIKKKMQSLLASFRRERQKLKTISGMGAEEVYDTKWFAFKSLLFLKDKNQPVETQDTEGNNENESIEMTQDEDLEESSDRDLNETISNENHADHEAIIPKRKQFVSPKRIQKKKLKPNEDPRVTDAYAVMTDLKSNISAQTKDGCSVYGEYIGFKLRSYNSYTRAIVEHHINTIIYNADMGFYAPNNNSNIQLPTTNSTGYYSSTAPSPALSPAASYSSHGSTTSNFNNQIPTTNSTGFYSSTAPSPALSPAASSSPTGEQNLNIPQTGLTDSNRDIMKNNLVSFFTDYKD